MNTELNEYIATLTAIRDGAKWEVKHATSDKWQEPPCERSPLEYGTEWKIRIKPWTLDRSVNGFTLSGSDGTPPPAKKPLADRNFPRPAPNLSQSLNTPKTATKSNSDMNITISGLILGGKIRGGKNNITVTRTGHRFPNKQWAAWRDVAVAEVRRQIPAGFATFTEHINVRIDYVSGDRRRRDFPAICDSIWRVLERAGIVADDALLWPSESSREYSKTAPGATIKFL